MLFPFLPFMVQFLLPNVKDTAVGKMVVHVGGCAIKLLPARASKQGNVIGFVRIYIYMCVYKKNL